MKNNKIFWIASYPKSGNTWIRSFLSSYLYTADGIFNNFDILDKIIRFESKRFFSNIADSKDILATPGNISKYWIKAQNKIVSNSNEYVFIKTHNFCGEINNNPFTSSKITKGFIYVVRDPRAVAVSFSKHTNESLDQVIDSMLSDKPRYAMNTGGYPSFYYNWKINYFSWKKFSNLVPSLIIKYEDLFNNESFFKITKLLDELKIFKSDSVKTLNAITSTSFLKMSSLEKKFGFEESGKNNFFYKGKKDHWKNILNLKQVKRIELNLEKEMKELGYK